MTDRGTTEGRFPSIVHRCGICSFRGGEATAGKLEVVCRHCNQWRVSQGDVQARDTADIPGKIREDVLRARELGCMFRDL